MASLDCPVQNVLASGVNLLVRGSVCVFIKVGFALVVFFATVRNVSISEFYDSVLLAVLFSEVKFMLAGAPAK